MIRLRRFQMTQTLHLSNSFCSVFTSIKTDNIQSAAFMLFKTVFKRITTTCVSSSKKSVSFFSTAAAGRAPPAGESIHNCSTDRSGVCEFPYILIWSSQGQTFLCSLVFFHRHRLRNAGCNSQRDRSAQKLPGSERHSAFELKVFLAWTGWKCGLE